MSLHTINQALSGSRSTLATVVHAFSELANWIEAHPQREDLLCSSPASPHDRPRQDLTLLDEIDRLQPSCALYN